MQWPSRAPRAESQPSGAPARGLAYATASRWTSFAQSKLLTDVPSSRTSDPASSQSWLHQVWRAPLIHQKALHTRRRQTDTHTHMYIYIYVYRETHTNTDKTHKDRDTHAQTNTSFLLNKWALGTVMRRPCLVAAAWAGHVA